MGQSLTAVEVERVSRSFGRQHALRRVSTRFEAGRVIALLGPNGAGKSTLIEILATLQRPDRGEVRYDGRPLAEVARRRRDLIGYVSHDALLYGELTGRENLRFYGRLYGVPAGGRVEAALLERVGLVDAADRLVRGYSRGMRQRLSVARALLHGPALLLMDEPFTGIDREGIGRLQTLLDEERAQGRIIITSTHRLGLGREHVDEVRVFERGRLRLARPLNPGERLADAYAEALGGAPLGDAGGVV